jgi:hypothetical protein
MNNMIKEADMRKKFFIISLCLFFLGTGGLLLPTEGFSGERTDADMKGMATKAGETGQMKIGLGQTITDK